MSVEGLSFEEAFARLETTVGKLERGELTLAEMVTVYEEGVRLCEHCGRLLDGAELRISRLAQSQDDTPELIPHDLHGSVQPQ